MRTSRTRHRYDGLIATAVLCSELAAAAILAADQRPLIERPKVRLDTADAARLEVKAYWEPIKESGANFHKNWDKLRSLRPASAALTYSGADFRAFLPGSPLAVGDIWEP